MLLSGLSPRQASNTFYANKHELTAEFTSIVKQFVAENPACQLLKYQQRHGYTNRDALRLFHAKPISDGHQDLYNWVVKGWDSLPEQPTSEVMEQIWWYEWVKRNPAQTHEAIAKGRLTHEMVAPVGQMDVQAWQLLFMEMPVGAMLRNLASLVRPAQCK
jgi:60 kDa SS-A/Ro ribonucleoprotein